MNALKNYACNTRIAINTTDQNISSKLSPEDKNKIEKEIEKTLQWVDSNHFAEEDEITDKIKELGSICKPVTVNIFGQDGTDVLGFTVNDVMQYKSLNESVHYNHISNSSSCTMSSAATTACLFDCIESKSQVSMDGSMNHDRPEGSSSSSFKKVAKNVASSLALATLSAASGDASGLVDLVDVMEIGKPSGSSPLSYKQQVSKKFRRYIVSATISAAIGDVTGLSGQLFVDAVVTACVESFLQLRGSGKAQDRARRHDPTGTSQHKKKLKDAVKQKNGA